MSKVISFRLNLDNPRDAKALALLQIRQNQGFSTRHTLTEALLNLDSTNPQAIENEALNDLLTQIKKLLEHIEMGSSREVKVSEIPANEILSEEFVASILGNAKVGIKINDEY